MKAVKGELVKLMNSESVDITQKDLEPERFRDPWTQASHVKKYGHMYIHTYIHTYIVVVDVCNTSVCTYTYTHNAYTHSCRSCSPYITIYVHMYVCMYRRCSNHQLVGPSVYGWRQSQRRKTTLRRLRCRPGGNPESCLVVYLY